MKTFPQYDFNLTKSPCTAKILIWVTMNTMICMPRHKKIKTHLTCVFLLIWLGVKSWMASNFANNKTEWCKRWKILWHISNVTNKKNNTKILLCDKNVKIIDDIGSIDSKSPVAYYNNPCILSGDFYAFYFFNNTITEKAFENLFLRCAKKNNLQFDYHFQSAKFETTEYKHGNEKYYLGYCVGYLEHNKGNKIISVPKQTSQNLE